MGNKFYENLKAVRERKSITQKEVCEAIGVAKSTYSQYESGAREPNVLTIKKIADFLNISADDLLGISEPDIQIIQFDSEEFTESELNEIKLFADFLKYKRKQ